MAASARAGGRSSSSRPSGSTVIRSGAAIRALDVISTIRPSVVRDGGVAHRIQRDRARGRLEGTRELDEPRGILRRKRGGHLRQLTTERRAGMPIG